MNTKLLLAAAAAVLSLGAAGAQAAPILASKDVVTESTGTSVEKAYHYRHYRYYYYYPYYYYRPYYYRYYYRYY